MPKNNFAVPNLSDFLPQIMAESSAAHDQMTRQEERASEMAQFRDIVRQEVQRAVADSERRVAQQIANLEKRLARPIARSAPVAPTPARPTPAPATRKRPAEDSTEIDWNTYANAEPATDSGDANDDGTGSDDGEELCEVPFSQCKNLAKALVREDEGIEDDDFTAKPSAEATPAAPSPKSKPKKKRRIGDAQSLPLGRKLANFTGVDPAKRYRLLDGVKSIGFSKWHPSKGTALAPPVSTKKNPVRHPASMLMASWQLRQNSNGEPVRPVDRKNVLVVSEIAGLSIDKVMDDEFAVKCLLQGWCVAPIDKLNELAAKDEPPATLDEVHGYHWLLTGRPLDKSIETLELEFDLTGLSSSELERMQRIAGWTRELQNERKGSGQQKLCITSYSKFLRHLNIPFNWPACN